MQFKYPEILYFLFLLIIPVIIHLFQLQRFEKVAFTNVKLLKELKQQTRKSSRLKKMLLLLTRLLLLASLIIAFAQPYLVKKDSIIIRKSFIYLDNSFSMQARGENGELLQRVKNDLVKQLGNKFNEITLITNNHIYKNIQDKNEILNIDYDPLKKDLKTILLQIDNLKSGKINKPANVILISDFQNNTSNFKDLNLDSLSNYYFVQTLPVKKENIAIDSIWINDKDHENLIVKTLVKSYGLSAENLSVSLFIGENLYGKSTISLKEDQSKTIEFSIPDADEFYGKITLDDHRLSFDNTLFFNTVKREKIPVLAIGENNNFLSKLYADDEFQFASSNLESLDFGLLQKQKLIIVNELEFFSNVLIQSLKNYQGNLVIIPSVNSDLQSYNKLLTALQVGKIDPIIDSKKYINKINFGHPFFKDVFEKKTDNYQYPMVSKYFPNRFFSKSSLLKFNNENDFLSEIDTKDHKIFWFSAPLNIENTNFINSPLVVPVFYNFSLQNFDQKKLYYTIGDKNEIQIKSTNNTEEVFHLKNKDIDFIPLQKKTLDFVIIQTEEKPLNAGIYSVMQNAKKFRNISFNFSRNESDLSYYQVDKIIKGKENVYYLYRVNDVIEQIKDQNKNKNLWQLFIIFALMFLGFEILIQKFFKY